MKLAVTALDSLVIAEKPEKFIGDKVYDSDKLDNDLLNTHGIAMIAPHRRNRTKPKTQDGRKLRRYQRRWKVERFFAWLQNFRRLVIRYERHTDNFLAFLLLACSVILLRFFLDRFKTYIPSEKHAVGKSDSWKIERKNLNFRTHLKRLNRKTIGFSKNERIHNNVLGMYINRYYFENGRYSRSTIN